MDIAQLVKYCMTNEVLDSTNFQAILDSITIKAVPPATATAEIGAEAPPPPLGAPLVALSAPVEEVSVEEVSPEAVPSTCRTYNIRDELCAKISTDGKSYELPEGVFTRKKNEGSGDCGYYSLIDALQRIIKSKIISEIQTYKNAIVALNNMWDETVGANTNNSLYSIIQNLRIWCAENAKFPSAQKQMGVWMTTAELKLFSECVPIQIAFWNPFGTGWQYFKPTPILGAATKTQDPLVVKDEFEPFDNIVDYPTIFIQNIGNMHFEALDVSVNDAIWMQNDQKTKKRIIEVVMDNPSVEARDVQRSLMKRHGRTPYKKNQITRNEAMAHSMAASEGATPAAAATPPVAAAVAPPAPPAPPVAAATPPVAAAVAPPAPPAPPAVAAVAAPPTVQKIIDTSINNELVKVNTCGFKNLKNLKNKFLQSLPGSLSLSEKALWADIFVKNYLKRMSPQLLNDLKTAKVKLTDYNDMVTKKKPLGFVDNLQWVTLCKELMTAANIKLKNYVNSSNLSQIIKKRMIKKLNNQTAYTLVFTGTSTTFYSENPHKTNHFFNIKGIFTADIDVAIAFKSEFRQNILPIMPHENYPSVNPSLKAQQISMADTYNILGLKNFYLNWGPYEHFTQNTTLMKKLLKNSKLERNVNIIIFKIDDTLTHNSLCDYRFYYPVPVVTALVAAAAPAKTGGSKKKRTVTIKSNAMPKTVKGLKTRKKLLKKKIKDAEKKVKLNKNRVIKLKGGSGNNNSSMGVITYRGENADIIEDNLVKKNGQILTPPHFMNYVNHKITTGNDILTWKKKQEINKSKKIAANSTKKKANLAKKKANKAKSNKLQAEIKKRQQTIQQETGEVNLYAGTDAAW